MKIVSLSLSNYRQFQNATSLDIPMGLIGISGPNGVGKSKLVEAIGYALYSGRVIPSGDTVSDVRSFSAPEGTSARVGLQFEVGGQLYEVVRTGGRGTCIKLSGCDDCLASGPREVTRQVVQLLHLTPDAFLATCVARQKEVAGLQALNPADRKKVVNRLIGVTAVDKAISLAEQERSGMHSVWEQANSAAQGRLSDATRYLEERQVGLEQASAHQLLMESAESVAKQKVEQAQVVSQDLHDQIAKIQNIKQELEVLNDLVDSLESAQAEAQRNIDKGQSALAEQEEFERVLRDTEGVQEQRCLQEQLALRQGLRNDLENADAELAYYCGVFEHLELLRRNIAGDEEVINDLQKQHLERVAEQTRAKHEDSDAQKEIDRHHKRHQSALELGEMGECEMCGQTFGMQLEGALSRYEQAEQAAHSRKIAAEVQLDQTLAQCQEIETQIKQRRKLLAERRAELDNLHGTRSEVIRCLDNVKNLEKELLMLPDEIRDGAFIWELWDESCQGCEARHHAEQRLEALRPLNHGIEQRRANLQSSVDQLNKACARKADLKLQLTEAPRLEAALKDARDKSEQARCEYNLAQDATRQALRAMTTTETQLQSAKDELEKARELQNRAVDAQRNYLVADRTEDLLRQVRDEILAEARPRITDLLENWASSLLSPHFHSIELTDDYRIRANLGSGPKYLEHFSGGEQTLLSVMLRVAIAIFCQERAGYETGFLVLDEVFGDQDNVRRIQLVEFLQELKPHFHQILVVNHIEAVTDMLDSILEVVSIGHKTSRASFRD